MMEEEDWHKGWGLLTPCGVPKAFTHVWVKWPGVEE